jgi:RNA polymerase sigma-70 factor, ECF subfamily
VSAVLDLVRSRVRIRFALTAEDFARCLTDRARSTGIKDDVTSWLETLSLDDLYLARACVLRDENAWAECSRLHFGFMREFAGRFLRREDAAEISDRVIADLWEKEKLARYEGRSTLRTWLGAVVAHAAIQAGKSIRRQEESTADPDSIAESGAAPDPEREQAARVLADITTSAIQGLPASDKLLLRLHYEQGLSLDQIVAIVGTSKATLSRRLKHLREVIRNEVERTARERYRASATEVRSLVDLSRLEIDLSVLLSPVKGSRGDRV